MLARVQVKLVIGKHQIIFLVFAFGYDLNHWWLHPLE